MPRKAISTDKAPAAIGTYSQAIKSGNTVYFSGQIAIDPVTQELVVGDFSAEVTRVFENIKAVAVAAGGSMADVVRITVYLTDLSNFAMVSDVMAQFFNAPYPARAALGVAALPKGATVEIDAIMVLV